MAGAGAKAVELPVEEENVASLRDEHALPGELLLRSDGAAIRADAQGARRVETKQEVLRAIPSGDGLRLDLRSVDGQGELALDTRVNRAGIEGDRQRTTGFEDRQMRRTANADLAAFDKIDARGAGFDAHVAAAAQDGFRLAVDDLDTHGSVDGDGFAVDHAHRVGKRFIGTRGGCGEQRRGWPCKPQALRPGAGIRMSWRRPSLGDTPRHGGRKSRLYYTSAALQPRARMMTRSDAAVEATKKSEQEPVNAHYDIRLPNLPWSRRIQIPIIAAVVYSVIRMLGPTLRYEVLGWQHADRVYAAKKQCIWAFWHRVIIPIVWWYRNHGVVVMNTTAFDGQWTRKVIEWLGFGTAQGSSSRGGLRGLAVMARRLEEGLDCAFTIDGPRGPRYIAKPGPVMLARKTGCPIMVFHIGVERGKTFERTWDHFLMPRPFSRTAILFAPPIYVPAEATAEAMETKHAEMQRELERVRDIAESWFSLSDEARAKHRAEFNRSNPQT